MPVGLTDLLIQSDDAETGNEEHVLQNPASSTDSVQENAGEIASKRTFWNNFLGAMLATGAQVASVLGSEIIQFEERGCAGKNATAVSSTCTEAFNSPFMIVWFNHSFTGLVSKSFVSLLVIKVV